MKIAVLPDGRRLEFPAETEDAVVDGVVRQTLGVVSGPEEIDEPVEDQTAAQVLETARGIADNISQLVQVSQQNQNIIAGLIETLTQLGSHIAEMSSTNSERADKLGQQIIDALAKNAESVDALGADVARASAKFIEAQTAPRSLVKSPDGKMAILQIERNPAFIGG